MRLWHLAWRHRTKAECTVAQSKGCAPGVAPAQKVALAQGVALTFGACTRCPWNRIAATWVIVSVPAR